MDNRKNLIKIIIVAIIIIIIILVLIISINSVNNGDKESELSQEQNEYLDSIENPGMVINGQKPTELKIDNMYFTIEACIKSYFEYIQNEDFTRSVSGKYCKRRKIQDHYAHGRPRKAGVQ